MKGVCKLYHTTAELRESHIFPKFIIEYFKRTGSRYLRPFSNPNKRMQDGITKPFFSHEAEQTFSIREKWFAEHIFRPFMSGEKKAFIYDDSLYYFLLSMIYRALLLELDTGLYQKDRYYGLLLEAAEEWRLFLSNGSRPKRFDEVNLFFTEHIINHNFWVMGQTIISPEP